MRPFLALSAAALALSCVGAAALPAAAQTAAPGFDLLGASQSPAAAPAGQYRLDPDHASVVARISHRGVSISTVRFGKVAATLDWNPSQIEKSKVKATVETGSLTSPIEFQIKPTGEGFLDVVKFPVATFESTGIKQTDATHGQILGNLTLLGITKPVAIDAELIGIKATNNVMAIGFSGTMKLNRADFGSTLLPTRVGSVVELMIDVEFLKQ